MEATGQNCISQVYTYAGGSAVDSEPQRDHERPSTASRNQRVLHEFWRYVEHAHVSMTTYAL